MVVSPGNFEAGPYLGYEPVCEPGRTLLWHNAVSPAPQGAEHVKEHLFFCCVPARRQKKKENVYAYSS